MERVAREEQPGLEAGAPAALDELEVEPFVGAVDLVADQGVLQPLRVGANLVFAAGLQGDAGQGEASRGRERDEAGARGTAAFGDRRLDEDRARNVVAQR